MALAVIQFFPRQPEMRLLSCCTSREEFMKKSPAGKQVPAAEATETLRHWSAREKTRIVRQHLRGGLFVADLAEKTGAAPGLIHAWIKLALERLDLDDRRT